MILGNTGACMLLLKFQVTESPFCTLWKSCALFIWLEKHPVNWKELPPQSLLLMEFWPLCDTSPWNTCVQVALLWALLLVYEAGEHTHQVSSLVWSPCLSHSLFRLWVHTTQLSRSSIFSKKNLGILPQYCYDKRACPNKPGAPYWNVHFMPCI